MPTQIIQKNYTMKSQKEQLVLPLNLGLIITDDDSVRLLSQVMEDLNYVKLMQAYSPIGRNPVVYPPTLFKILVYAYSQGIFSSRKIEEACKRDINFIWLLDGKKAPDHNTISRFRNERIEKALEDLFYQFIKKLNELDEIQYENLFVDGTKIEANANKYTFVWKKSTVKYEKRLHENIRKFIIKFIENYSIQVQFKEDKSLEYLQQIYEYLIDKKETDDIVFVYGKGKKKTQLQRDIEQVKKFIEKQRKYNNYKELFDGRNSFSKTDTDATFMHMKDDHMRNSQLKPGYNIQIGVENEYIVAMDIYSERSDQLTLIPFLNMMETNLETKYTNIVADAGYESEENYMHIENNEQYSFIKPSSYEKQKKRSFKKQISKRENMNYDSEKDYYICHNNRRLTHICDTKRKSKSGYVSQVKVYECENCIDCRHKSKCTKSKGNKKLYVSHNFIKKRQASYENITSEKGILLRINRSIQVEGAFGVLKHDYGFRRFLMRGKKNVKIEFMLLCFGFNINKLHNRIMNDRFGKRLFEKKLEAS